MLKSNLIDIGGMYAFDISVEGEKSKITSEYITILYSLLSNKILDEKSIEMLTEIVTVAIKETNNDFEKFVKGVLGVYRENNKKDGE